MIEELLRKFSRENFDDANYVPLLHGHSETAKPLSLIIKRKRPIWKRPFAKDEMTFLAGLEKYVSNDCEKEYQDAFQLKMKKEQVIEKVKTAPVESEIDIGVGVGAMADIKLIADDNLGDLLLGRVRQEYILDPDLRGLLSIAVLDADKMIAYQDHELLIITSVVYSEKFEVVGERGRLRELESAVNPPSELPEILKSKIHAKYRATLTPPGVAKRNLWGPILFTYCPVQYNQKTKKLEIMKGKFVGKSKTTRHMTFDQELQDDSDSDDEDNNIDDADDEDGQIPYVVVADDILLDDFTDKDNENIERIYKNVLMTTKSRAQQKALVKKYLGWFEILLADDKMKIILKEPLTSNDCTFLRSLFVAAFPGQDTLDFTNVKRAEIHGCGFILKLLDELSDEEWKELGMQSG
ncbi:PREDICTED: uncharacterized protein LOC107358209 isoform X1 [Acropora digitifera]|uniref:uncharacterized protein LOC107358209 isoform X1 n=1 Tax=Acropora digitifera TaxID=70779 RepID=UPI00077A74C8|nr:PREDICTED: uncharacterized protein LOC107358209 isoform X1 [Acropora digitifera]XP_015780316.1 PREDICTED: uncharacterized protein LOC107358209 isoform X1 [Acropora digitifera]XP_015780317.1 PREDICTED: uncharacterized protein LOC107358209 isoform X1 [Acropora digitifera]XP_015780318.1 PREDICTED: uncharacterized protein LOC107358209 isoform X1 [Acropora digitifera]